ncbi:TylF/MycF family methyltransferase [Saccharothrix sp. AJ9571]|nr:TylF/MycF family methyltransferase [Saccharothrix sp. AJ9571]
MESSGQLYPGLLEQVVTNTVYGDDPIPKTWLPKLSTGGLVIIGDYYIPACRKAVEEFRETERIDDPLEAIDEHSVF